MEQLNENICLLQNAKLGFNFINLITKRIISSEWYDNVSKFCEGFARVKKDGLGYSFINTEGKRINDEWYYGADNFSEGFAIVYKKDLGWNFINTEGKYLINEWYDWVDDFENGFAKVYRTELEWRNDVYYYVGTDGKLYDSNKRLV